MTPRSGFALAAVLCALVLMAMIVAVTGQRALLEARQGVLDTARSDVAAALATGEADALESAVDSTAHAKPPGALLAAGSASAGSATARWVITATGTPFAIIDISAEAPAVRGAAREFRRGLLAISRDSSGALWWVPAGGGGRLRLPSP